MVLSNRESEVTLSQMPLSQTIFFKIYFEEVMGTKENKQQGRFQYYSLKNITVSIQRST